jgi:NAD(P)-dependent dehydrogenase (short-subunit alcohol dehydrogenase family)
MRKVLVTGVDSEFGEAIVDLALKRGDEVYSLGKKNSKALIARAGYHFFQVNFDDDELIKENIKDFLKDHKFDLVILNSSTLPDIMELDQTYLMMLKRSMSREVWRNKQLIDVLDLYAKVRQIVAVSSSEANLCSKGWGSYSIAKSALNAMIKTYASEKPWTHFSAIDPGVVMTSELKRIFEHTDPKLFPSIKRMREGPVLTPEVAAKRFLSACGVAIEYKSGSFLDIKSMDSIFDI